MAKKQKKITRFAFGTIENPGSSVWRVNVVGGKGDVYINNLPELGNSVHISLHSTGQFHIKLGSEKLHHLAPPWNDPNGLVCGPIIFFYQWRREIPPLTPTGKTKLVKWLGWPNKRHIFLVKTYYCERDQYIGLNKGESLIDGPIEARLFDRPMNFYLILEHRPMKEEEITRLKTQKPEKINFKDNLPIQAELIRVQKTPQGPSAIIIDRFNAKLERQNIT